MSAIKPLNPVHDLYSFDDLSPGCEDNNGELFEFTRERRFGHCYRLPNETKSYLEISMGTGMGGQKGCDGRGVLFIVDTNEGKKTVFCDNVWIVPSHFSSNYNGLPMVEFAEGYTCERTCKKAYQLKPFEDHVSGEYFYLTQYSAVPITKESYMKKIQEEKDLRQKLFEKTRRWRKCSEYVKGLRQLFLKIDHGWSSNHPHNGPVYCFCCHPAQPQQVTDAKKPSFGRWFWTCIIPYGQKDRCNFFQFVHHQLLPKTTDISSTTEKLTGKKRCLDEE